MQRLAPTVDKAVWITRSPKDQQIPRQSQAVVIEKGGIAAVPVDAETIEIPDGVVFAGFLKAPNHTITISGNVPGTVPGLDRQGTHGGGQALATSQTPRALCRGRAGNGRWVAKRD